MPCCHLTPYLMKDLTWGRLARAFLLRRWTVPGRHLGRLARVCARGRLALRIGRTRLGSLQGKEDTMLLGIDYGTTRTVVAAVDRGNYPVVSFQTAEGDSQDWYPSLIAARGDERLFGLNAACCQDNPGWELLRSFKRQLATLGPATVLTLGTGSATALELLTAFLAQLRRDLVERSNLRVTPH